MNRSLREDAVGPLLGPRDVWVFTLNPALISPETKRWCHDRLLDDKERARRAALPLPAGRNELLLGRALLRTALSTLVEVDPAEWRFENTASGKPYVAAPLTEDRLELNLSHTRGLIACAIANGRRIGIDVERVARRPELLSVAEQFFAPTEVADLMRLPPNARIERFFEVWTLKESYLKARGLGLTVPLDRFWFIFGEDGPRLEGAPELDDPVEAWEIVHFRPAPASFLSVCVERTEEPSIVTRRTTRLGP